MFTMISLFKYEKMGTQYTCMQRNITYLESESVLTCIHVSYNIALYYMHYTYIYIYWSEQNDNSIRAQISFS